MECLGLALKASDVGTGALWFMVRGVGVEPEAERWGGQHILLNLQGAVLALVVRQ